MNGKEFVELIFKGGSINCLPILENPTLDNLENLELSERLYAIYSYLDKDREDREALSEIDKSRLNLFRTELRFLYYCTERDIAPLSWIMPKIANLWQRMLKEDRERKINSIINK